MVDSSLVELVEEKENDTPLNLEKFLDYWSGDLSENTLASYIRYLSYFDFDPLGTANPDVMYEDVAQKFSLSEFRSWTRKRAKQRYGDSQDKKPKRERFAYYCLLALRKYLEAVGRGDLRQKLPESSEFENPEPQPKKVSITQDQFERLEKASDGELRLAIQLLYLGGLRAYELLNMTVQWLEFRSSRVEVEIPAEYAKGQKGNAKPELTFLPESLSEDLKQHVLDVQDYDDSWSSFLEELEETGIEPKCLFSFKEESSKNYSDLMDERRELNRSIRSAGRQAGLNVADELSSHALRRSFIHRAREENTDIDMVSTLARHKSIDTTKNFYLKRNKEERAEAYSFQ